MRQAVGAFVASLLFATIAHATPTQDLERGRNSYRLRDYQSAVLVLNLLLYPGERGSSLSRRDDLIEAHLLLAGALFELGNRDRAREEFDKALQLDPDRTITNRIFSDGAIQLYETAKAERQAQDRRAADAKRIAEAKAAIEAYKKSLVVYEATPFGYNFLPFGIAQFSQKRYVPGTLFAGGQVAMLAANVSIYVYLVGTYGFTNERVPRGEGLRVRRLQQFQIGTGIAFLGLYGLSIFDAIRHYKPRLRVEGDDSLIPEDLRDRDNEAPPPATGERKMKKVSWLERLQVAPMISDDGVGIGIGWEND